MGQKNQLKSVYNKIAESRKQFFEKEYLERIGYDEKKKKILGRVLEKLIYFGVEVNLAYDVFCYIKQNPKIFNIYNKKEKSNINRLYKTFSAAIDNINLLIFHIKDIVV